MAAHAFEVALGEPDNDASHSRLRELIETQDFSNFDAPAVVKTCLRAFCDTGSSPIRRRWVGIALAQMIDASSDAIENLKQLHLEWHGLGTVILSNIEREETKIVAGIIIRQALQQGLEYCQFWPSEKVTHCAPNFPRNSGPRWMALFQNFLDTWNELALASPPADSTIVYAISLVGSDGFRWRDSSDELLLAVIQAGLLTIIVPGSFLRDIQFMDIPVSHICSIRSQQSVLHNSQAQTTGHKPFDLIMKLKPQPWTYRLNSSSRVGNEITLLFHHSAEVEELENRIKSHQKGAKASPIDNLHAHPMMSASSPINLGPPPRTGANEPVTQLHSSVKSNRSERVGLTDNPVRASRSRSVSRSSPVQEAPSLEEIVPEELEETSPSYHTDSSRSPVETKQLQAEKETKTSLIPAHQHREVNSKQSPHAAEAKQSKSKDPLSPKQIESTIPESKEIDCAEGKLKKVTYSTKMKASTQLCAQSDSGDLSKGRPKRVKDAGENKSSSFSKTSQRSSREAVGAPQQAIRGKKSDKSRTKRKADDDDEFVPHQKKPKRQEVRKRNTRSSAASNHLEPKTKSTVDLRDDVTFKTNGTKSTAKKVPKQRWAKPALAKVHSSSPPTIRHPLIDGLLSSQRPLQTSTTPVKRPAIRHSLPGEPSTPSKPRSQPIEISSPPMTPKDLRERPNHASQSHIPSSPPAYAESRESGVQRSGTETEILSSNSKPIPASPNAESTAISGHADRDDVDFEKMTGEFQTAKSDPFKQRVDGQKTTSFTRRLTGEVSLSQEQLPKSCQLCDPPEEIVVCDFPDIDDILSGVASEPLPQDLPRQMREEFSIKSMEPLRQNLRGSQPSNRALMKENAKWMEPVDNVTELCTLQELTNDQALQSAKPKETTSVHSLVELQDGPVTNVKERFTAVVAPTEAILLSKDGLDINIRDCTFTSLQQMNGNTTADSPTQNQGHGNLSGDITLVNNYEDEDFNHNGNHSPIRFYSSPPDLGSPSSHSSTSAESSSSPQSPLPTSEVEEMEWEASLQPHQRSLHDLLIRTSKRVMRHIVDNEVAVTDIADGFAKDGEHLLDCFLRQYVSDSNHVLQDLEDKTKGLKKELESAVRQLGKDRKRISAMA